MCGSAAAHGRFRHGGGAGRAARGCPGRGGPPRAQWVMWWASAQRGGRWQPGKAQPVSVAIRSSGTSVGRMRVAGPMSRGSLPDPRTAGWSGCRRLCVGPRRGRSGSRSRWSRAGPRSRCQVSAGCPGWWLTGSWTQFPPETEGWVLAAGPTRSANPCPRRWSGGGRGGSSARCGGPRVVVAQWVPRRVWGWAPGCRCVHRRRGPRSGRGRRQPERGRAHGLDLVGQDPVGQDPVGQDPVGQDPVGVHVVGQVPAQQAQPSGVQTVPDPRTIQVTCGVAAAGVQDGGVRVGVQRQRRPHVGAQHDQVGAELAGQERRGRARRCGPGQTAGLDLADHPTSGRGRAAGP